MTHPCPRLDHFFAAVCVLLGIALSARSTAAQGAVGEVADPEAKATTPERYVLDYPPAERFCPPVQSFFYEVVRTFEVVRGRRFTHQPNGGYGLPVVYKVNGRNLLHLGADVGWHRVGDPVYAVAAGVVRVSEGPGLAREGGRSAGRRQPKGASPGGQAEALHWGNRVVIEHRFPGGEHFTTIYGHLGVDRQVEAGDVVQAGQQIGTIGRKHFRVNGGYDPHVHFAVREGRLAEPGCTLMTLYLGGKPGAMKLVSVGEEEIEVELPPDVPAISINLGGRVYPVTRRDGKLFLPARMLWDLRNRPGFEIVGYGLSTEGWRDPVAFLRECGADLNPAPFRGPGTRHRGRRR